VSAAVVCCGLTTIDVTQVVTAVPTANQKVVARASRVHVGGPAANAALTVAALGGRATLVTALGASTLGDLARHELVAGGVEVVDLATDDGAPPVSTVLVTAATGERAVASTNHDAARVLRAPEESLLDGVGCVLVDGHLMAASVALCAAARARGVPTVLDGGSDKPGLPTLLTHLDAAVLSDDFVLGGADARTAAAPADLLDAVATYGPAVVAQSHGADAIECLLDGVRHRIEVPHVPAAEVVDTLGAGDVLHGTLAHAIASRRAWPEALAEAVRVASGSVRFPGALGWAGRRPTSDETGRGSSVPGTSNQSEPTA
jgi:sugar/nucleoside kinase (ribokinase family)